MAEGGTSPLGDPGTLHMYNMNGGTHKLAELVSGGDLTDGIIAGSTTSDHSVGMFGTVDQPPQYSMDTNMHAPGYIQVEPLDYGGDNTPYEEMKRPQHSPSPYYSNMEPMQNLGNLYNSTISGFPAGQDMYKMSTDSMGYVHMLSNSGEGLGAPLTIKKEKPDYDEHGHMAGNQPLDVPYPPNTCIADWNYYNSINAANTIPSGVPASNFSAYNLPQGHQYQAGHLFNNSAVHHHPIPLGLSNIDIHNQAKEISNQIISSEWSSESLYKSPLYSNIATETTSVGRKRRSDPDKQGRNSKSRRKKSLDSIGGHSKTVASILLSENSQLDMQGKIISARSQNNGNVLDSSARNTLVTTLMDNLRSTVQFESFCLSFPRSNQKEVAFCHKIISTTNTINSIDSKVIKSEPFPSSYVQGASKVITAFKKALNSTGNAMKVFQSNDKVIDVEDKNLSCDQVEQHLPHCMVWVVKVGSSLLTANWEGQFVVTVNPILCSLCFSIFQFQPKFSPEGCKYLQQTTLSTELAKDIIDNMEQFEVSRQLRFDVDLSNVVQLYLHSFETNQSEGCLILEVTEEPSYFQRWLHTSAEEKNKWRRRDSFFSRASQDQHSTDFVYIGGLLSELNELVALLLASSHDLEVLYETGVEKPMKSKSYIDPEDESHLCNKRTNYLKEMNTQNGNLKNENLRNSTNGHKVGSNSAELREAILQVLVYHEVIDARDLDSLLHPAEESEVTGCNNDACIGIALDKGLSNCFRDYVDYSCDSAKDLDSFLGKKVNPRSYGFCESDFDLSAVPGGNIDNLTVAELITSKCSKIVYFSFCKKEVGQLGHDQHCSKCRACNTWKNWHCDSCNRCSETSQICEHCGHLKDDQNRVLIKPMSVFKSQIQSRTLNLDKVKDEWEVSLSFPDNDIVFWELPNIDFNVGDDSNLLEYNSNNAMVDQLGLLNPVGFLLGQLSSGATRKHRRYKGIQPLMKGPDGATKGAHPPASACSLQ